MREAFFVLLAACLAHSSLEEVAEHNLGIADDLLGAQNPCGLQPRSPTIDDLSYVSGIRILCAVPQIDNLTTNLVRPKIIWSWFAWYPERIAFKTEGKDGCPDGEIEFFAEEEPRLQEGAFAYRFANRSGKISLSAGGPNPIELELANTTSYEVFEPLYLQIEGKIERSYSYFHKRYVLECRQQVCGCVLNTTTGKANFEKFHNDSIVIFVETGPVEWLWITPPLAKMLDVRQNVTAIVFAKRMPAKIEISKDGKTHAQNTVYSFETKKGSCGEMRLFSRLLLEEDGLFVELKNETHASQTVSRSAKYLPIVARFELGEKAGKSRIEAAYYDWFSNKHSFVTEMAIRSPLPYAGESAGAIAIRQGNQESTPAAYPSVFGWKRAELGVVGAVFLVVLVACMHQIKGMLSKIIA
ncbi:MAG: hypothetical protein N3G80_02675 [Candidatus Micrarchaeota archaeon]|nr:hypothetical protein [Candidatus Micrarchaeota archaeon]